MARADGEVGPRPGNLGCDGVPVSAPAARDDRNLPLEGERWFRHGGDDTPKGGAMSNENSLAGGPAAAGYGAPRVSALRGGQSPRPKTPGPPPRPTLALGPARLPHYPPADRQ